MKGPSSWEREASKATREVARRAIRRLDVLEWVILSAAAGVAIVGGGLVAWILPTPTDTRFRAVWIISAVLLFAIPGVFALGRIKREDRKHAEAMRSLREERDG